MSTFRSAKLEDYEEHQRRPMGDESCLRYSTPACSGRRSFNRVARLGFPSVLATCLEKCALAQLSSSWLGEVTKLAEVQKARGFPHKPFELVRPRLSAGPKSAQTCPPHMRRLARLVAVSYHRDPMAADSAQALVLRHSGQDRLARDDLDVPYRAAGQLHRHHEICNPERMLDKLLLHPTGRSGCRPSYEGHIDPAGPATAHPSEECRRSR